MEIKIEGTLAEAIEELEYQRSRGREAHFSGKGNGTVVIEVENEGMLLLQ